MLAAGEFERGAFSRRDLRRTAETHMTALGVSSDVRAQIQSHGSGGIQAHHHDRHDYIPEKRAALMLWVQRLKGSPELRRQNARSGRRDLTDSGHCRARAGLVDELRFAPRS